MSYDKLLVEAGDECEGCGGFGTQNLLCLNCQGDGICCFCKGDKLCNRCKGNKYPCTIDRFCKGTRLCSCCTTAPGVCCYCGGEGILACGWCFGTGSNSVGSIAMELEVAFLEACNKEESE